LAEAETQSGIREFLKGQGVDYEAFMATKGSPLSDCVFFAKNLPAGTSSGRLEELYAPYGDLGRIVVVPGGALAIVEFLRPSEARKAFQRTAFSNFGGAPLYLQWAPKATFSSAYSAPSTAEDDATAANRKAHLANVAIDDADEIDDDGDAPVSVFVKNLNFSTTREELEAHFAGIGGIRAVTIVERNGRSMGYGFVEMASKTHAVKAIKTVQGTKLDGHVLELSFSKKQTTDDGTGKKRRKKKRAKTEAQVKETSKLVVRNVPFEASKKELQDLFGAYASLKQLRLPLKFDRSHRGYAFAEYDTKSEARKAKEALENAHLYGRRLVIEYALVEEDEEDEDEHNE